jgi:hypothetical protein
MADPVGIDDYMSLRRASKLCGISSATLRAQANKGTLRTKRVGNDLCTTWRWLYEYLESRDATRKQSAPLPPDYQAPE